MGPLWLQALPVHAQAPLSPLSLSLSRVSFLPVDSAVSVHSSVVLSSSPTEMTYTDLDMTLYWARVPFFSFSHGIVEEKGERHTGGGGRGETGFSGQHTVNQSRLIRAPALILPRSLARRRSPTVLTPSCEKQDRTIIMLGFGRGEVSRLSSTQAGTAELACAAFFTALRKPFLELFFFSFGTGVPGARTV